MSLPLSIVGRSPIGEAGTQVAQKTVPFRASAAPLAMSRAVRRVPQRGQAVTGTFTRPRPGPEHSRPGSHSPAPGRERRLCRGLVDRKRSTSAPLLIIALFGVGGCSDVPWVIVEHPIPRSRVADFFAKDFELPAYRPATQGLGEKVRSGPPVAEAALGDAAGSVGIVSTTAWSLRPLHLDAVGGLGDMSGASVGGALVEAVHEKPLPRDYSGLETAFPYISVDSNTGVTAGVLPVSVFSEDKRITNIFAPQITWNEINGTGALFRMRRYFTNDADLSVDAGSSTGGAQDYELDYNQAHWGPYELLFFRGKIKYVTELADRFYGLGSKSNVNAESSYTFRRAEADAGLGVQLPFFFKIEFAELFSTNSVAAGKVPGIPTSTSEFPDVKGMNDRLSLLAHRITLTFDTRDKKQATQNGFLVEAYYEIGDSTLASDLSFQKVGVAASGVLSYWEDEDSPGLYRLATAARITARWVTGRNTPFYEQTSIGGKTTLRGFGDGRFVAKNGFVAGIEERWNVWAFNAKGQDLILQVAGFGEMGRVFQGEDEITINSIQFATGGAVRLIIPASDLVLSLDLGVSKEGEQTFLDLGYPF
jgi:hypothetical protein